MQMDIRAENTVQYAMHAIIAFEYRTYFREFEEEFKMVYARESGVRGEIIFDEETEGI
jgi:hypothetical protein